MLTPLPPIHKMSRRILLRTCTRLVLGTGAVTAGGLVYGRYCEPSWIEITHLELNLPHLAPAFDGFRLAHISDIHIEEGDMCSNFPAIADLVSSQGADCIVITGDYVTHEGTWQEGPLLGGLQHLKASQGVFAVLGNHDHCRMGEQGSSSMVRRCLSQTGIIELRNEVHPLRRDEDTLWMCGVDDVGTGHADLESLLQQLPSQGAAILLGHQPDHADLVAKERRFDLMLSGHSHGGQIILPVVGALGLPVGAKKYSRGLYQVEGMLLYTNRGLGTTHLPIRIGARPEITLFTLRTT